MGPSYKIGRFCLFFSFMLLFMLNSAYANICVGNAVNIRKTESKLAEIVGKLNYNEPINLLGISGEWVKISKSDVVGFVLNDFIKLTDNATICATNVNIRKEASPAALIVTKLNTPFRIGVDGVKGEWYSFKWNGSKVWIHKSFVTLDGTIDHLLNGVVEVVEKKEEIKIEEKEVANITTPVEEGKTGKITGSNINVRAAANTSGKIVGKLNTGETVSVLKEEGNWYAISYQGITAYISRDFVKIEEKEIETKVAGYVEINENVVPQAGVSYLYVNAYTGLNFRNAPNTSSQVLSKLSFKTKVEMIEDGKEWCKVKLEDGTVGYLSKIFLVENIDDIHYSSLDEMRQKVVEYAKRYLGTRYVYGGMNFATGVDCSGFTSLVMKNFGITLNRSSKDQVLNGVAISKSELLPADLLFFSTGTVISHVGIYIGENKMIHASTPQTGVIISDLNSDYNLRTYRSARRVIY